MAKPRDVATCIVVDGGSFLIFRRSPETGGGGLWNFPGGSVDPGEELAAAASRELEEEAGIQAPVDSLDYLGHLIRGSMHIHFFITSDFSGEVEINWESDDYRWITADQAEEYLFVGGGTLHEDILRDIKNFIAEV
jgi:8-oxo-dGTP diphosphatase